MSTSRHCGILLLTMYDNNRFIKQDRTTEEDHEYLKQNYESNGFKSAAAFLESIIQYFKKKNK